jgi:hypothetical protein
MSIAHKHERKHNIVECQDLTKVIVISLCYNVFIVYDVHDYMLYFLMTFCMVRIVHLYSLTHFLFAIS